MADLGKIQFKRTSTSGKTPTGLSAGELAMNVTDGRLFSSDGTNLVEFGLSKGGTIDGALKINGSITTSGGGIFAAQDGNVYLNKPGATGWMDSLFLRKDISDTLTGNFTATGNLSANSGLIMSNDGYHYLRMGVSGTNNYTFGNYGGTFSFLNSNDNSNVLSLEPGSASFSNGTSSVSLGKILFNPNSTGGTGTNSNNDYSRGIGFNIESVDTSNSNYPSSMGSLMTSVLTETRKFQLFSSSGSQNLYFRDMRNDGSGSVSWNQLYSTAFKPSASDVGSYSTSQSDSLFSPKSNFYMSGTDAHMQGTGSSYFYINGGGSSGVYDNSTIRSTWKFDSNGNLINGNIPVSNGGTGATNASDARVNLGLGNGSITTYQFPGVYTGGASWIKIGSVYASGSDSSHIQIILTGVGNYGVDGGEFNLITISGRFDTRYTTTNMVTHRRSSIISNDIHVGYVANTTTDGNTTTTESYDVYLKDNSGWCTNAQLTLLSSNNAYFTGGMIDGNFDSWVTNEPSNITYVEPLSFGANDMGSIKIDGEFVSSNSNGVRIANGSSTDSNSVLLRTDGSTFNLLISPNGVSTGSNWNSLRPLGINTSSGLVTMGNGVLIGGGTTVNDSFTVTNGVINTNDPSHYIDLGENGNDAAKWVVYNGQHSFVNSNGNVTTTQFNNGTITTTGSISTTGDNTGIIVGNGGDLGLIKKSGLGGKVVIGKANSFTVSQSQNTSISATDSVTDIFSIDGSGNTHVFGTLTTNGSISSSNGLTVSGGDLNVPVGKIYGKDSEHYIDMSSDTYTMSNYGGQFYFSNSNGGEQAELSYSGNIKGSQWGGGWLNDYMNSTYATLSGNNTLTGDLSVNGTGSFGGSLGAASLSISGSSTIFNLNVTSGLSVSNSATINGGLTSNGSATISGDLTVNNGWGTFNGGLTSNGETIMAGPVTINNSGLVVKNGVGSADSSGNYYTSGYRVSGRGSQFADTYFQEITGSEAYLGLHVSSGGSDGWYQFTNGGAFINGTAEYGSDGNIKGSAWGGGYLNDWVNNKFNDANNNLNGNFVRGVSSGSYISQTIDMDTQDYNTPAGSFICGLSHSSSTYNIVGYRYAYVMYNINGNWINA